MADTEKAKLARETFATALGFFVWAWNDLHEGLGHLFSAVISDGVIDSTALAVWHSPTSDRAQRKMLLSAAEYKLATRPKLLKEIIWLGKRIEALADKRNDVVHASYALLHSKGDVSVVANAYYGNNRSQKLSNVGDLAGKLKVYKNETSKLASFLDEIYQCVIDDDRELPQRPLRK